jgi:hypothetical protein
MLTIIAVIALAALAIALKWRAPAALRPPRFGSMSQQWLAKHKASERNV